MKKLNLKLVQYIIKTDFFFSENKNLKNITSISNKKLNILDIIKLHLSLKQFIRVLQFAKKKSFFINIFNSNKQYVKILHVLFIKKKFKNNVGLNCLGLESLNYLHIFINNKNKFKNNFLVSEINSNSQIFNKANYKIFNNLNSFKKIVFFIAVIQNILENKNENAITK